jgi:hypothetical protein
MGPSEESCVYFDDAILPYAVLPHSSTSFEHLCSISAFHLPNILCPTCPLLIHWLILPAQSIMVFVDHF